MKFKPRFEDLPRERLEDMAEAGARIEGSYRLLRKASANVVAQVLAHQGTFFEFDHYPKGDVYDDETHSQYYYHAHRGETGEHGHFHTFLRAAGMPEGIAPAPYDGDGERPLGDEALSHFVAISMNGPGFPIAMFTTNRWVTGETFYRAEDAIAMLDRFDVEHVFPCLAVNMWIGAMVRLFRPQVEALLLERDRRIADWAARHPDTDVYEDRDLEITSILRIDVAQQTAAVERALSRIAA
jgi:hypothetical protein